MIMALVGISHGAQPIIGYNRGAGHYLRIRKTLEKAIIAATTIVVVGFVVTLLIPKQLICMFGNEPEFIRFGEKAIRIWFLLLPVVGCQTIGAMYFQAVGKPKVSLFLTMTRQLLFLIPAILVLSSFFGMKGILYAAPVSDGISFLVTGIFLLYEIRRLNRLIYVERV
jgi:Na+-driven multidrug efflux pump